MGFLAELGHGPLSECLEQLKGPLVVAAVVVATKEVARLIIPGVARRERYPDLVAPVPDAEDRVVLRDDVVGLVAGGAREAVRRQLFLELARPVPVWYSSSKPHRHAIEQTF